MEVGTVNYVSAHIGRQLRRERLEHCQTQDVLAGYMRVLRFRWNRSTVRDIECGERAVTVDELVALGLILGVDAWRDLGPNYPDVVRAGGNGVHSGRTTTP